MPSNLGCWLVLVGAVLLVMVIFWWLLLIEMVSIFLFCLKSYTSLLTESILSCGLKYHTNYAKFSCYPLLMVILGNFIPWIFLFGSVKSSFYPWKIYSQTFLFRSVVCKSQIWQLSFFQEPLIPSLFLSTLGVLCWRFLIFSFSQSWLFKLGISILFISMVQTVTFSMGASIW